jgi:hypothetical protein
MSPGRNNDDAPEVAPDPVVTVPDELDELIDTPTPAAAVVLSLPVLVVRRLRWALAPVWVRLARWVGEHAAYAARQETAARTLLLVTRYERRLRAQRLDTFRWKTRAEALQLEAEFLTKLHKRATARVDAETAVLRHAELAATQRGNG